MGKLLSILLLFCSCFGMAQQRSLTVDDLLTLSSIPSKNFDDYLEKKGFNIKRRALVENCMGFTFFEEKKSFSPDSLPITRSLDYYKNNDTWCLGLHTDSKEEYLRARGEMRETGFFSGTPDRGPESPLLYQQKALTIETAVETKGSHPVYTIMVKRKELPEAAKVRYADDLLRFESHEYLAAFFGENNVAKDVYFLGPGESKKCSVLFPNSSRQVVFIWDEENNYRKILFAQVSGTISATSTVRFNGGLSQNIWTLRNGVHSGMMIKDLLDLNANDFRFYGFGSEYSLMVEPKNTGKINFKRIGIRLTCFNCPGSPIMQKTDVSAEDAVNNNLALHISAIMISPQ